MLSELTLGELARSEAAQECWHQCEFARSEVTRAASRGRPPRLPYARRLVSTVVDRSIRNYPFDGIRQPTDAGSST
jgi:hypothetical protein